MFSLLKARLAPLRPIQVSRAELWRSILRGADVHFSDHLALRAGSFQTEVSQDDAILPSDGFGISTRCTLSGLPGNTLIAFIFPFSF